LVRQGAQKSVYLSSEFFDVLVLYIVACTAVVMQRLGKHVPPTKNTYAIIEEWRLLCGPCRDVITRTVEAMSSV
jgi:hypothetical protein